jgi:thioredoxin-related protein
MHRILTFLLLMLLSSGAAAIAQTNKPEPAGDILREALQKAESSQKNVFLIFHASWCGWCKRLDKMLEDPGIKASIGESYVVTRLDVLETGEKQQTLENPGGRSIMTELGGAKSGLPFYAFLDAAGKKLADSDVMPKVQNIGYPGSADEIKAFEGLLKQTAPRMTAEQRARIVAFLQQNAPH